VSTLTPSQAHEGDMLQAGVAKYVIEYVDCAFEVRPLTFSFKNSRLRLDFALTETADVSFQNIGNVYGYPDLLKITHTVRSSPWTLTI
jgi:hypothetical protein